MNRAETALALTLAAAFDRRTLGDTDVEAWHLVLGDLDFDDVKHAIAEHYATRRDWLMPADVRDRVKTMRTARLTAVPDPIPDADPDDVVAYLAAIREGRHRIASSTDQQRPIAALVTEVEDGLGRA